MDNKKTIYNISKGVGFSTSIVNRVLIGERDEIFKNLFNYGKATIPNVCTLYLQEKKVLKNGILVPMGYDIVAKPLATFEKNFNEFAISMLGE